MMLSMINARCGQEVAAAVTDELIHHRMRNANERQRMELRARLGLPTNAFSRLSPRWNKISKNLCLAANWQTGLDSPRVNLKDCSKNILAKRRRVIIWAFALRARVISCCKPVCRSSRWRSPVVLSRPRISRNVIVSISGVRPLKNGSDRVKGQQRRAKI